MDVCSFGRSFLGCPSGLPSRRGASARFALRALRAARVRWPHGHLVVDAGAGSVRWMVGGCCGVLVTGAGPRPPVLPSLSRAVH